MGTIAGVFYRVSYGCTCLNRHRQEEEIINESTCLSHWSMFFQVLLSFTDSFMIINPHNLVTICGYTRCCVCHEANIIYSGSLNYQKSIDLRQVHT